MHLSLSLYIYIYIYITSCCIMLRGTRTQAPATEAWEPKASRQERRDPVQRRCKAYSYHVRSNALSCHPPLRAAPLPSRQGAGSAGGGAPPFGGAFACGGRPAASHAGRPLKINARQGDADWPAAPGPPLPGCCHVFLLCSGGNHSTNTTRPKVATDIAKYGDP